MVERGHVRLARVHEPSCPLVLRVMFRRFRSNVPQTLWRKEQKKNEEKATEYRSNKSEKEVCVARPTEEPDACRPFGRP